MTALLLHLPTVSLTQQWFFSKPSISVSCLFKPFLQRPTLHLSSTFPLQFVDWPEARQTIQLGNVFFLLAGLLH